MGEAGLAVAGEGDANHLSATTRLGRERAHPTFQRVIGPVGFPPTACRLLVLIGSRSHSQGSSC